MRHIRSTAESKKGVVGCRCRHNIKGLIGRGTTRAENAQGTSTQSHTSPSILVDVEKPLPPVCAPKRSFLKPFQEVGGRSCTRGQASTCQKRQLTRIVNLPKPSTYQNRQLIRTLNFGRREEQRQEAVAKVEQRSKMVTTLQTLIVIE